MTGDDVSTVDSDRAEAAYVRRTTLPAYEEGLTRAEADAEAHERAQMTEDDE